LTRVPDLKSLRKAIEQGEMLDKCGVETDGPEPFANRIGLFGAISAPRSVIVCWRQFRWRRLTRQER